MCIYICIYYTLYIREVDIHMSSKVEVGIPIYSKVDVDSTIFYLVCR